MQPQIAKISKKERKNLNKIIFNIKLLFLIRAKEQS